MIFMLDSVRSTCYSSSQSTFEFKSLRTLKQVLQAHEDNVSGKKGLLNFGGPQELS
jgi:hypothetical protein